MKPSQARVDGNFLGGGATHDDTTYDQSLHMPKVANQSEFYPDRESAER